MSLQLEAKQPDYCKRTYATWLWHETFIFLKKSRPESSKFPHPSQFMFHCHSSLNENLAGFNQQTMTQNSNCTLLCKRGLCYFCNSTEYKCRTIRWDSSGGIVTKLQDGPLRDEASILDRNIVLYTIASLSPGAHPSSYPNLGSSYPGLVWPRREV